MTNRRSTHTTQQLSTLPTELLPGLSVPLRRKRPAAGRAESLGESLGRGVSQLLTLRAHGRAPAPTGRSLSLSAVRPLAFNRRLRLVDSILVAEVARVAPDLPIVKRALRLSSVGSVVGVALAIGVVVWTGRKLEVSDLMKELATPVILHAVHGATRLALPLLAADIIISAVLLARTLPRQTRPKAS